MTDPVAELEELLETGGEEEVEVWASRDFVGGASDEEIASAREQCRQEYEKIIAGITEAWGPPNFRGSLSVSEDGDGLVIPDGYPWSLCEFAEEVASWRRDGDWVACVWWEQQDPVMPFSVFVGVTEVDE
jgi:hypothetical protein